MGRLTVTSILLLILAALAIITVLLQPKISLRKGRAVVKTNAAFFYIPSLSPIKVYSLDPQSTQLNRILKNDTLDNDSVFGIYVKNLNTKQVATLNAGTQFRSASLYKLFVMYTIYDQGAAGKLDIGKKDITDNLNAMITVSSNDAAYYLINNYTSWQEVTAKMQNIGLNDTNLNQDPPVTTPADVGKLLELIADGKAVNFDASVKMLSLMTDQTRRDRIPALLPASALVANKTGELDDVLHDAAVVGSNKSDYVIVIMSQESADLDKTRSTMSKISGDVYNYFNNQDNNFPEIL